MGMATKLFERNLSALYVLNFCGGMSMGLFGLLTATWMKQLGTSDWGIGLVSSAYYALQIVGAAMAERMLRRMVARSAIFVGLVIAGVSAPWFVFATHLGWLGVVRGLAGLGVGICVTSSQTALVSLMPAQHRAVVSGLHALAFALGLALGPVVGPALYASDPRFAALFGAVVFLSSAVLGRTLLKREVSVVPRERRHVARKLGTPLHAIFAYGFAESTLFSVYPGVLVARGLSVRDIGFIFTTFVLGSIVTTLPIARLADTWGRRPTLLCCAAVSVLTLLWLEGTSNLPLLLALAFVAGGSVGASYALGMALVGDALQPEELASGMALFTAALGVGCALGPIVTGALSSTWGGGIVFAPTALLFALVLPHVWAQRRATQALVAVRAASGDA